LLVAALVSCRAGDTAKARDLSAQALKQRRQLQSLLSTIEPDIGLELTLQNYILPLIEVPAAADQLNLLNLGALLKDQLGRFLVKFARSAVEMEAGLLRVGQLGDTPAPAWEQEGMRDLIALALKHGITDEHVDEAMGADDPRAALVQLLHLAMPTPIQEQPVGDAATRADAQWAGLKALHAYKARQYSHARQLMLRAIKLRKACTEDLLRLLFFAERQAGSFELAMAFYMLPFLGMPDAVLRMSTEQGFPESLLDKQGGEGVTPLVKSLNMHPQLRGRKIDDVFLNQDTMELVERALLAGRAPWTPDAGYVRDAKEDETGVRNVAFHAEQCKYLLDRGLLGPEFQTVFEEFVAMRIAMESSRVQKVLAYGQVKKAAGFVLPDMRKQYGLPAMPTAFGRVNYRRPVQIELSETTLHASAMQPDAIESVQNQFIGINDGIAVADNMLRPSVIEELWKFCVESTVYFDTKKGGIYMGGYARKGFTSPLILKVAEEIKGAFPLIFHADYNLTDFWAYNYDNNDLLSGGEEGGQSDQKCAIMEKVTAQVARLTAEVAEARLAVEVAPLDKILRSKLYEKEAELRNSNVKQNMGIDLHADPAAVTVNLWLTPDKANLDPASGGLIVYKKKVSCTFAKAPFCKR
jgi:hypothetical protein